MALSVSLRCPEHTWACPNTTLLFSMTPNVFGDIFHCRLTTLGTGGDHSRFFGIQLHHLQIWHHLLWWPPVPRVVRREWNNYVTKHVGSQENNNIVFGHAQVCSGHRRETLRAADAGHPLIWLKAVNQAQIRSSEADLVHQMVLALNLQRHLVISSLETEPADRLTMDLRLCLYR